MEWLKKKRLERKMTQSDVAKKSKITAAHYNYIENCERRPSPEVAKRIANVLGFKDQWYKLLEPKKTE